MQWASRLAFFIRAKSHVGIGRRRCSYARSSPAAANSTVRFSRENANGALRRSSAVADLPNEYLTCPDSPRLLPLIKVWLFAMPPYVAGPHPWSDKFVPRHLSDGFGQFPIGHGNPLANQLDRFFLIGASARPAKSAVVTGPPGRRHTLKCVGERSRHMLGNRSQNTGVVMAKTVKSRAWTKDNIRELKTLARQKVPVAKIAKSLKRTLRATQQKAYSIGVSLNSRG